MPPGGIVRWGTFGLEPTRGWLQMGRESKDSTLTALERDVDGVLAPHSRSSSQFVRPHIVRLAPYIPVEPFEVLSLKFGRPVEDFVKLDANENPYGPAPEVLRALGSMSFPHIYPDPESRRLRSALSDWTGVPMEHLLVGCGADELLDLLMRCTLDPGDYIVDCPPTFGMYAFDAEVNGGKVTAVPRLQDFGIDIEGIRRAVQVHKPKLLFLTSPNNPDGGLIDDEELLEVLKLPVLVILDEAYIEFADEQSRILWVQEHPNLVVLRTFSKCAALAGLRVGYGAFPLDLVEYLWRAKQPYNVSVAAEVAACAALTNRAYIEEVRQALVAEREQLQEGLKAISFLEPFPSSSNFILCKVEGDLKAKDLKSELAERGIIVRHFDKEGLKGYVRISIGRPEHTDMLIKALREIETAVHV